MLSIGYARRTTWLSAVHYHLCVFISLSLAPFAAAEAATTSSLEFTCSAGGAVGSPYLSRTVESVQACQALCMPLVECSAVVFLQDGTCVLYHTASKKDVDVGVAVVDSSTLFCVKPMHALYDCREGTFEADFSIEGVTTTADCLQHCSAMHACIGVSFNDSCNAIVHPKAVIGNGTACMKRASRAPHPSFACRIGGFRGELLVKTEAATLAHCQSRCGALRCANLQYIGTSCSLYAGGDEVDGAVGVVCKTSAPGVFRCEAGVAYGAADIAVSDVASLDGCKRRCAALELLCIGVNYNSVSRRCDILNTISAKQTTGEAYTSCLIGPSSDADWMQPEVSLAAHFRKTDKWSGDVLQRRECCEDECRGACHVAPLCTHYAVRGGECVLLAGQAEVRPFGGYVVFDKVVDRSVRGYRCVRGSYRGGVVDTILHVRSKMDCTAACTASPRCATAVLHDSGRCVLTSLEAVRTEGVVEGSTACTKDGVTEVRNYRCVPGLWHSTGSAVASNSSAECRALCDVSPACKAVYFAANKCLLQHTAAGVVLSPRDGGKTCVKNHKDDSRMLSILAEVPQTISQNTATVSVKFVFDVNGLTPQLFKDATLHAGLEHSARLTYATLSIKVPVGSNPATYLQQTQRDLKSELNRAQNVFMAKMNPTLADLGLDGVEGKTEVTGAGYAWDTQRLRAIELALLFNASDVQDYTLQANRMVLARTVAIAARIPASNVSISHISNCPAEGPCTLRWEAASPASTGGVVLSTVHKNPSVVKVVVSIAAHKATCTTLYEALQCDAPEQTYLGRSGLLCSL